ncbi:hypothetical protein [Roseiarcus fermentans]|nr:hypothetical protein [Roseiarcus fermentans]
MTWKTLAVAAALLGATALSAHAAVVGTQAFADLGSPTADGSTGGDLNTATQFTLGDLVTTTSQTGVFSGLSTIIGPVAFNTSVADSLSFTNPEFGSFTSSKFTETINVPGAIAIFVLGEWTPGSFGGVTGGPYASGFTITLNQNPAHTGAISDSATFSVPPSGVIPELSTWAMMGLGFAGLGLAGYGTSRRTARFAA